MYPQYLYVHLFLGTKCINTYCSRIFLRKTRIISYSASHILSIRKLKGYSLNLRSISNVMKCQSCFGQTSRIQVLQLLLKITLLILSDVHLFTCIYKYSVLLYYMDIATYYYISGLHKPIKCMLLVSIHLLCKCREQM